MACKLKAYTRKQEVINGQHRTEYKSTCSNAEHEHRRIIRECGIDYNHLKQVSAGRVKMTADDLKRLSAFTGVPAENIRIN